MSKYDRVVIGFSEEYRDAHWIECRHSTDLRTCDSALPIKRFGEHPYCARDGKICDAKWRCECGGVLERQFEEGTNRVTKIVCDRCGREF